MRLSFFDRLYPERSWSISKLNTFHQCKRKYYYSTYAHWRGWEYSSSELAKTAYRLNKLQNIHTISGIYIHSSIKSMLKSEILTPQEMYKEITRKIKDTCKQSLRSRNEWIKKPNKSIMLQEYYYDGKLEEVLIEEIKERIWNSCNNIFRSWSFREITEEKVELIEIEEDSFNSFEFNGTKIYALLDVLYKFENEYVIVDWKTGNPDDEEHRLQMLVYTLYILSKHNGVKLGQIRCVDEYLMTGERYTNYFTRRDIEEIEKYISESMQNQGKYIGDIEINKPKLIEYFPKNTSGLCKSCNFRELCEK